MIYFWGAESVYEGIAKFLFKWKNNLKKKRIIQKHFSMQEKITDSICNFSVLIIQISYFKLSIKI